MLLFIGYGEQELDTVIFVSIHLMLLFIVSFQLFQVRIDCVSIHLMLLFIKQMKE